jgi:release factor glutamine methyltransferase
MAEFHPLRLSNEQTSLDALNDDAVQRAKTGTTAEMPSLDHLKKEDYAVVYEPSDDTYLLLDGILSALSELDDQEHSRGYTTLEIGCGTGVPTIYLASELQRRFPHERHVHHVTDINPDALRIAQETAAANHVVSPLHVHPCDLASDVLETLRNQVDIILFNPPYVPTPDDEVGSSIGIEASWAGGLHGRRVVDRAIPQIPLLLKRPKGVAFIITVDDNKPIEMQAMFASLELDMKPWVRRRACNEYLSVQRVQWMSHNES